MSTALWIQASGVDYTAEDDRLALGSIYTEGIVEGLVLSNPGGLSVAYSAGSVAIDDPVKAARRFLVRFDASGSIGLTGSTTNHIYVTVDPDTGDHAVATGSTPSVPYALIGSVTTNGSAITSIVQGAKADAVVSSVPVGAIMAYGGSAAPSGWQICDGSVSATTALSAIVGANVPDLRGRFILGVSGSHARNSTGGAETVTLSANEMPSHAHGIVNGSADRSLDHNHGITTNGQHTHYATWLAGAAGSNYSFLRTDGSTGTKSGWSGQAAGDHTHTTTGGGGVDHLHSNSIQNSGGGAAHTNMPPFYSLIYIIRCGT